MSTRQRGAKAATPTIPRERWSEHPNWPTQTLLLGSHESFRRISRVLVQRARAGDDVAGIGRLYRYWIAAMRSHEHYEERKLYPFLAKRWKVSCADASAGHELLHQRDAAVRRALASPDASSSTHDAREQLLQALEAHDQALVEHLRLEEDLVIPLLLALDRDEFNAYYRARY